MDTHLGLQMDLMLVVEQAVMLEVELVALLDWVWEVRWA